MENKLTIQTIRWELQTNDLQGAMRWQDEVSSFCQHQMNPILERTFSSYNSEQNLIIDKLELDLRNISDTAEFKRSFEETLSSVLKKKTIKSASKDLSLNEHEEETYDFISQLFFYLTTSQLPWYSSEKQFTNDDELLKELTSCDIEILLSKLRNILKNDFAIERLLCLFAEETYLQQFIIHVSRQTFSIRDFQFLKNFFKILFSNFSEKPNEWIFIYKPLLRVVLVLTDKSPGNFFREMALQIMANNSIESNTILKNKVLLIAVEQIKVHSLLDEEKIFYQTIIDLSNKNESDQKETKEDAKPIKRDAVADQDEYFISNAGLVLLYPYLKRLFNKCDLTTNEKFISRLHQAKAIGLLEFIIRGNKIFKEYHLALNKILCGYDIQATVYINDEYKFSDSDTDKFLMTVIKNWPSSGLISSKGLRQSFLMRSGKLIDEGTHWQLLVEKKGWDVVMKTLSYPLGVIKLPWMIKPIYVEW